MSSLVACRVAALLTRAETGTTFRRISPYLRRERKRLVLMTVLSLGATVLEIATPFLVGIVIDDILTHLHGGTSRMPYGLSRHHVLALLAVGALLRGVLIAKGMAVSGRIGEGVARRLRDALWTHLQRLPVDYTRRRGPGRLLLRFISDTRAVQRLVTDGLVRTSQDVVLAGAIVGALFFVDVRMAVAALLTVPGYAAIFGWLNPQLRDVSRATRRRRSALSSHLHERLEGIAVVKTHVRYDKEAADFRRLSRRLAERGAGAAALRGRMQGTSAVVVALSGVLVLTLATHEIDAGRLSGGGFIVFHMLLGHLVPILQRVAVVNRAFQEAHISVTRLAETLAEPLEDPEDASLPALDVNAGLVRLDDVTYRYDDGRVALDGVSLEARRGQMVAVVGRNGSGKSTLVELLLRLRQPQRGRITIDGQDVATVSVVSLRTAFGCVSQDAPLFDGTIAENVAYAVRPGTSPEQVLRAIEFAGVDRLAADLPDGLDTRVGSGGRRLSGGQRQRVALARALAMDPEILLLDEATAALDAAADRDLVPVLRALADRKTVIVVTHRLPVLSVADVAYVLDEGRVVATGTHDHLLRSCRFYARLFRGSPMEDVPSPVHAVA